MVNESATRPINGLDLISEIDQFQIALRKELVGLPPSPAMEMIEYAFVSLGPLLAGLKKDYPVMMDAFHKQRELVEATIDKAKQNVAKAKDTLSKLPTPEQILKNISPVAPEVATGTARLFSDEMKSRYMEKPAVDIVLQREATAWQDWTIAR